MKPYFSEDGITIYHGDCREVLPQLERVRGELLLSDPPFNFEPAGGGIHSRRDYATRLDESSCCDFDPSWFLPLVTQRCAVLFCNKVLIPAYLQWATDADYLWDVHAMQKTKPIPAFNNHFLSDIEYVIVARKSGSHWNMDCPFDHYRKVKPFYTGYSETILHPAQKPLGIMNQYIEVLCPSDGAVLDPFMGSGTTLVAAKKLGRVGVGIEIEEKYCEIAARRLSQKVLNFESQSH